MREVLDFNDLKSSGTLPSPKGVALKVMQLCQDENLSLKDLAQTIQGDPALAGRIIKIANYVNPNRSRPIAAVTTDTLILIGIHAVRQVVLGLSLVGSYRDGRCKLFDYDLFWSHSVAMGSAAHAICSAIRVAAPAEMFNCGLMSGIGQLALVSARPESYCEMLSEHPNASSKTLLEEQLLRFGMTQREIGMFMLQDWGIPKLFVDALYYHEDPLSSGYAENSRPLRITYTLQLSSLLARACLEPEIDDALLSRIKAFGALLELDPEQLEGIVEQTKLEWKDWCALLDIRSSTKPAAPKPQATEPAPEETSAPAVEENITPVSSTPNIPLRILIASSNDLQANLLKKVLTTGGHETAFVDTGKKALELASQYKPHVLIADWLLPELDGLSLCRELRKTDAGATMYCMLVTPFEDERRKVDAYEAGADELLRTPLNSRLLIAQLSIAQRYAKMHGLA